MKKRMFPFTILFIMLVLSCTNNEHTGHSHSGTTPKTQEDSLLRDIDDGHIVGMSKMAKLHKAQQHTRRVLDSIAALPASVQKTAAGYVEQLNETMKDLEYADFAMEKWMTEYNADSLRKNKEQRLLYLQDEKMKVDKMKTAILTSLQKADSLLGGK